MSIRNTIVAVLVLVAAGCTVPLAGLHGTMHPSVVGDSSGAGVAVGAAYAQTESGGDSANVFAIPYGEGWARFKAGPGQFELRIGVPFASTAYRWMIVDGSDSSFGFSLIPALGLALERDEVTNRAGGMEVTDVDTRLLFAPELAVLFTFVQGQLYLSPRFGWVHINEVSGEDVPMEDLTTDYLSGGVAVGWNFAGTAPFWYSIELSFFVVDDLDDDPMEDDGTTWYFIPTFGIHTG